MIFRLKHFLDSYKSKRFLLVGLGIILFINIVVFPLFPRLFGVVISPNAILDLKFGYSQLDVQHLFDNLHKKGRHIYLLSTLFIDIPYLIFYSFYYAVLLNLLLDKKRLNSFRFLIVIPFCIGFFDLLENIGIISLLQNYPNLNNTLVSFSALATMLKWSFAIVTILSAIILFFTNERKARN